MKVRITVETTFEDGNFQRRDIMKWSGKFRQRAKMYSTVMNGYENDEATELFRQV